MQRSRFGDHQEHSVELAFSIMMFSFFRLHILSYLFQMINGKREHEDFVVGRPARPTFIFLFSYLFLHARLYIVSSYKAEKQIKRRAPP